MESIEEVQGLEGSPMGAEEKVQELLVETAAQVWSGVVHNSMQGVHLVSNALTGTKEQAPAIEAPSAIGS